MPGFAGFPLAAHTTVEFADLGYHLMLAQGSREVNR